MRAAHRYGVRLRRRDGRALDRGFAIRDQREADWLRAELRRSVGLGADQGGALG